MKKIIFIALIVSGIQFGFSQTYTAEKYEVIGIGDDDIDGKMLDYTKVTVYPNPVSNVLTVESEQNIEKIAIYNRNGVKQTSIARTAEDKIALGNLKSGLYTVVVYLENGDAVRKTIVKA